MKRYTYGFLQDYFSAKGLKLTRTRVGRYFIYNVTNHVPNAYYDYCSNLYCGLSELIEFAVIGGRVPDGRLPV